MASAWGSSWASAWGDSWGSIAAATTDTADGGYPWEWETADEIRKRLKRVEEAQEQSRRKRKEADKKLADELDRAYRRLVLREPEIAVEVARAIVPAAQVEMSIPVPAIDFRTLANLIETTEMLLGILERDRQAALAEEEDIEVLLMAAVM